MPSTTQNGHAANNGDKNLAEWPTLGDVSGNVVKSPPHHQGGGGHPTKAARPEPSRRDDSPNRSDDSAKENDDSHHHRHAASASCRGGPRRKGSRQKWVPVPIAPIPYRKRYERGSGRPAHESRFEDNDSDGNKNEHFGSRGGGRFRGGKRGRGFSHNWKQRREDTARGEEPTDLQTDAAMYYDPYLHSHYAAMTRRNDLKKAIRNQIEYYFSDENLVKDFFMRRRMDSMGYVPVDLVASFHRVKSLTVDLAIIVEAVNESDKLDVLQGVDVKLRPVVDPLKWPIQDFNALRPDVPDFIPGQPYFSISSLVECMQNFNLFSPVDMFQGDVADEVFDGPDILFDASDLPFDAPSVPFDVPNVPFDAVMQTGFAVPAT